MTAADDITQAWLTRLEGDLPTEGEDVHRSIVQWLLGTDPERFEQASAEDRGVLLKALDYRYQILRQRYWKVGAHEAYQRLIKRLGSLFLIRSKVRTWIALSRDRRRTVMEVIQEVIQEMLQSDRYLKQQISWIGECTERPQLRNLLTLATIEEYCMRPIRNQPLLVFRFVNYLRCSQRGGMTQIPSGELIRLVSEEIATDEADNSISLLDLEAIAQYEAQAQAEENQMLREKVKQQFTQYLAETLDATAAQWLELHLQGYTQEAIAQRLNLSTKEAYRLREKIRYHAIRVFTLKEQPELVFSWLKTSLKEHNLGLLPDQWDAFVASCTPFQQQILRDLKAGRSFDQIARDHNLRVKQVTGEWAELYLKAQSLRQESADAS